MVQPTQKYNRTLSGSLGAGMKSLVNGERRYYVLEHKISSKYHKAGESQRIIVDQIEMGRDSKCQVRFDESFGTVSRRHAAIVRDGDNWRLVQLSKTNSTYLNGHKVEKDWYLQNGDEIQLSTNGPKMGFIVPAGEKGLMKSIGLTARIGLFGQQALRPYKQMLILLSCILLLCLFGGIWKIREVNRTLVEKSNQIAATQARADSLALELKRNGGELNRMAKKIDNANKAVRRANQEVAAANAELANLKNAKKYLQKQCVPYTYAIYRIREEVKYPDGSKKINDTVWPVGTGFLLSDGRFVTARHITEFHYFYPYAESEQRIKKEIDKNAIAHNGGDITTSFVAVSPRGDEISFTNKDCKVNRSGDKQETVTLDNGQTIVLQKATESSADWAYIKKTNRKGLAFNAQLSGELSIGTELFILGFPYGRGATNPKRLSPVYSHAVTAQQGLDEEDHTIMTSNNNTQPGNSGGPVFVYDNGKYIVIGLVSGSTLGKGRVVPIKAIK